MSPNSGDNTQQCDIRAYALLTHALLATEGDAKRAERSRTAKIERILCRPSDLDVEYSNATTNLRLTQPQPHKTHTTYDTIHDSITARGARAAEPRAFGWSFLAIYERGIHTPALCSPLVRHSAAPTCVRLCARLRTCDAPPRGGSSSRASR